MSRHGRRVKQIPLRKAALALLVVISLCTLLAAVLQANEDGSPAVEVAVQCGLTLAEVELEEEQLARQLRDDARTKIGVPYVEVEVPKMPEWMARAFGMVVFVIVLVGAVLFAKGGPR